LATQNRSKFSEKERSKVKCRTKLVVSLCAVGALSTPVLAGFQFDVVPPAYENTAGGTGFLGPLSNSQRTYQMLMHESMLTNLLGRELTGISFRSLPGATTPWPANDLTYGNYDIYLSQSVAPVDRSLTFADNIVGTQTQVRSGGLTIAADSYPSGGNPNDFGPAISFNGGWVYSGGHLLVEIRHTGSDGVSRSVDARAASSSPDYGNLYSAAWTSNYEGTSGSQGNFAIVRFTSIPAPGALALLGIAGIFGSRRRR
jgi:hypothetical protein